MPQKELDTARAADSLTSYHSNLMVPTDAIERAIELVWSSMMAWHPKRKNVSLTRLRST